MLFFLQLFWKRSGFWKAVTMRSQPATQSDVRSFVRSLTLLYQCQSTTTGVYLRASSSEHPTVTWRALIFITLVARYSSFSHQPNTLRPQFCLVKHSRCISPLYCSFSPSPPLSSASSVSFRLTPQNIFLSFHALLSDVTSPLPFCEVVSEDRFPINFWFSFISASSESWAILQRIGRLGLMQLLTGTGTDLPFTSFSCCCWCSLLSLSFRHEPVKWAMTSSLHFGHLVHTTYYNTYLLK